MLWIQQRSSGRAAHFLKPWAIFRGFWNDWHIRWVSWPLSPLFLYFHLSLKSWLIPSLLTDSYKWVTEWFIIYHNGPPGQWFVWNAIKFPSRKRIAILHLLPLSWKIRMSCSRPHSLCSSAPSKMKEKIRGFHPNFSKKILIKMTSVLLCLLLQTEGFD